MKQNQLSRIIDLIGGGLQCEFGNLLIRTIEKSEIEVRGMHTLSIFDCSWRVRKDVDIILTHLAVDSYEDFLPLLLQESKELLLQEIHYRSRFDISLLFSGNIVIDIFLLSNDRQDPCFFTDRDENIISINILASYGIKKIGFDKWNKTI